MLKNNNTLTPTYAQLNNITYVSTGIENTTANAATTNNTITLSNPVANIKGLFYSVQVGVYIRPVTSAQLFNITPLYDEFMANGYIRYLSGIYTSLPDAVAAKNDIVVKGVKDAFVVVYYNGKKITYAEAKTLLAANTALATTANNTANTAVLVNNNQGKTNVTVDTTKVVTAADKTGIIFMVSLELTKKMFRWMSSINF